MKVLTALAATGGALLLAGCIETTESNTTSGVPSIAEQACLRDVTETTNNPDVALLGSSFSEAGTEVIVGVGPNRARWKCIGYSDGTTDSISSLTDEGSL